MIYLPKVNFIQCHYLLLAIFFDDDSQSAKRVRQNDFFAIFDGTQMMWGRADETTG